MLDEFFSKRDTEDRLRQKKASLVKCINTAIARTERKTGIYETDISGSEDFDDYRIKGELITATSISPAAVTKRYVWKITIPKMAAI